MSVVLPPGAPAPHLEPPVRRRAPGPSLGPLPLSCVVVVELGLAAAVVLVATDRRLMPLAGVVLSLALLVGLLRRRGRWIVGWIALGLRFRWRARLREAEPPAADVDPRLRALRLVTGDMTVDRGRDHDGREVGLVGHEGAWSAVLAVDAAAAGSGALVVDAGDAGAPSFPLSALAATLSDRGVVLDGIGAVWHCRPAGAGRPGESAAAAAYREVLGPLPSVARRDALLVVRLDPARCPDAVSERGGGVVGAHRALIGALARIERVLAESGGPVRPLDADEVLRAAAAAAEIEGVAPEAALRSREYWGAVVLGGTGHATFAVTAWPDDVHDPNGAGLVGLAPLTGTAADATTLALRIDPGSEDGVPGLRAAVRVVAADPAMLEDAGADLMRRAREIGVGLDPLDGQHAEGLAATLPLGTTS